MPQMDDLCVSQKRVNFLNSHSLQSGPIKKKKKGFKITYGYTSVSIYGSKFQNLGGGQKNSRNILEKPKFLIPSHARCLEGVAPHPKMVPLYSLGACLPTTPKSL